MKVLPRTREILGALHARHDLFNLLPILLFHTLALMLNIYILYLFSILIL